MANPTSGAPCAMCWPSQDGGFGSASRHGHTVIGQRQRGRPTMTRLRDLMRRKPKPGLALPAWLDIVLLRYPELEAVFRSLRLRGGPPAVRAQLRAGGWLAAADRRPSARSRVEPGNDERDRDQCRDYLLRTGSGAPRRGRARAA